MKLTMSTVSTLKLPAGASERIEFDDDLPGFGLRLRNSTVRWIYQYKTGNQHRRVTIGNAKALSVTQARKRATRQGSSWA